MAELAKRMIERFHLGEIVFFPWIILNILGDGCNSVVGCLPSLPYQFNRVVHPNLPPFIIRVHSVDMEEYLYFFPYLKAFISWIHQSLMPCNCSLSQCKLKGGWSHEVFWAKSLLLTPYTLTSESIFSILFSIHFVRCWQGEFIQQSRASVVGDHLLYSHDLDVWFRGDVVRRK